MKGITMSAFDTAMRFFTACEAPEGWSGCKDYVEDGAALVAQCEPLVDVTTVEAYCDWMHGFGTVTAAGSTYTLHSSSYDEKNRTALFFATYHAKHTGEGGPVPPTNKEVDSHYVYVLNMSEGGKVAKMTKVWNAPWAMRGLGWIE
jgi:hypothetical protein